MLGTLERGETLSSPDDRQERRAFYDLAQLAEKDGLLRTLFSEEMTLLRANILPRGRAVLSGEIPGPFDPPASTHQTISISGGNVQVGNYNTQHIDNRLQAIVDAIRDSDMQPDQKTEALGLFGRFVGHPALGNVLQGASILAQALGGGA